MQEDPFGTERQDPAAVIGGDYLRTEDGRVEVCGMWDEPLRWSLIVVVGVQMRRPVIAIAFFVSYEE